MRFATARERSIFRAFADGRSVIICFYGGDGKGVALVIGGACLGSCAQTAVKYVAAAGEVVGRPRWLCVRHMRTCCKIGFMLYDEDGRAKNRFGSYGRETFSVV